MKKGRRLKNEKIEQQEPIKKEPYTFVAYVSGPIYKFDVDARDCDEAYAIAMTRLKEELSVYDGKVRIERIELERFTELYF